MKPGPYTMEAMRMGAEKQRTTKKVAKKAADRAAAPPGDPGLFAALEQRRVIVKAADRAEETSRDTRAKADFMAEAAAGVDIKKPAQVTPEDYATVTQMMIDGIRTPDDVTRARVRFKDEARQREAIGVPLKDARLLKAALDGRCNRVKDGGGI